jgi:hypothetical protein
MKRFTTLLIGAYALTASAAINLDDYTEIQLGTDYPLTELAAFRGKFTAPASGTVVEYATVPVFQLDESTMELVGLEDSSNIPAISTANKPISSTPPKAPPTFLRTNS